MPWCEEIILLRYSTELQTALFKKGAGDHSSQECICHVLLTLICKKIIIFHQVKP